MTGMISTGIPTLLGTVVLSQNVRMNTMLYVDVFVVLGWKRPNVRIDVGIQGDE
jgi:hypothetical protein